MKMKPFLALAVLALARVYSAEGVTMRDNFVVFAPLARQPRLIIKFDLDSYHITAGQPWGGIEQIDGGALNIKAGRQNSPEVRNWVKYNQEDSLFNEYNSAGTTSGLPDELNFAVKGNLKFYVGTGQQHLECPSIILAQGHYLFVNNWWLFNNHDIYGNFPECRRDHCTLILCHDPNNPQVPLRVLIDPGDSTADFYYRVIVPPGDKSAFSEKAL